MLPFTQLPHRLRPGVGDPAIEGLGRGNPADGDGGHGAEGLAAVVAGQRPAQSWQALQALPE